MKSTLNDEILNIIRSKTLEYRNKLFCLRLNVKGDEVRLVNEYYYMVRALSFVAKKYFFADNEALLKKYVPYFWQPKKYMTEEGWFENQLLIKISNIKKDIRDLRFDKLSLKPDENYVGIHKIDHSIGEHQFEIEFLQQVVDYILSYKWKTPDYISFDIYIEKVHQLSIIKRLEKEEVYLADIIDDINSKHTVVYASVLLYKLGLPQKMKQQLKNNNYEEIGRILSKWFIDKTDYKTIVKVFNYLEKKVNNIKIDKLDSSIEQNLAIIQEKYKLA